MNKTTTIIVDDHAAFRRSLREFVETIGGVEVVGEAADGQQGLDLAVKLRPQLVLMDICMPHMNGTDACRAMKQDNAALSVVLYSADSLEIEMAVALDVADFCLAKELLLDELPAWIGDTFSLSQRQTCPHEWQRLSRSLMMQWNHTISVCLESETISSWRRLESGSAVC